MTDDELTELEDAGTPSMQPPGDKRLSRYEAGAGAVLIALMGAAIIGGLEMRGEVDVIASEVEAIKRAQTKRDQQEDSRGERERDDAARLARIEAMLESALRRLDRIERDMAREGAQ